MSGGQVNAIAVTLSIAGQGIKGGEVRANALDKRAHNLEHAAGLRCNIRAREYSVTANSMTMYCVYEYRNNRAYLAARRKLIRIFTPTSKRRGL